MEGGNSMELPEGPARRVLVVIPTLNEEDHIEEVIATLIRGAHGLDLSLAVADGGSTDRTREIVAALAASEPRIRLVDNPGRIQSAGINRAVELAAGECEYLIRADAHARYPERFCATLVAEALRTGADSVVVSMTTRAEHPGFQTGVAAAQNSLLGTGGAAHRTGKGGRFVDHGHHALMRLAAFRAVGGYDPTFAQNEDAELDHRLGAAGFRIWMTDRTEVTYFPRARPWPLARQYWRYGRSRARMLRKHRARPRLRQVLPVAVPSSAVLALIAGLPAVANRAWLWLSAPFVFWVFLCVVYGAILAIRRRKFDVLAAAPAGMIMHFSWGAGFLRELMARKR